MIARHEDKPRSIQFKVLEHSRENLVSLVKTCRETPVSYVSSDHDEARPNSEVRAKAS